MEKVLVLMSTYNGEKFLKEQIESLLSQKNVEVHILVRDDGSTDSTLRILEQYKGNQLDFYTGDNLKPARSFMNLIYNASEDYDYYALCDQDDVWLDNKLFISVSHLKEYSDRPALFYCGMSIVDNKLTPYNYYFRSEKYSTSLYMSALFGDEIAGCTMAFNRMLLLKLKEYKPQFITLHDGWIHRVCLCTHGKITFDKEALILYRQHENNVEGMKKISHFQKLKALFSHKRYLSRLAKEMLTGYRDYLSSDERIFLERISNQNSIKNKYFTATNNKNIVATIYERLNLIIKVVFCSF